MGVPQVMQRDPGQIEALHLALEVVGHRLGVHRLSVGQAHHQLAVLVPAPMATRSSSCRALWVRHRGILAT